MIRGKKARELMRKSIIGLLAGILLVLAPYEVSSQYIITVPLRVTVPASFQALKQNIPFTGSLSIAGGVPTAGAYTCAITSGSLPTGLSLSGCTVSGTPTGTTAATVTISVTDALGQVVSTTISTTPASLSSIAVTAANPNLAPTATLQLAGTGTWSDSSSSDLTTTCTWTSGTPSHATVGATTGLVTGVAAGTSIITCAFNSVNGTLTVTVTSTNPAIANASLPNAQQNIPYSPVTLSATGGTAPYTWAITVGSLPTGLSLSSSTGVISGTPTGTTQTLTFQATDSLSATATKAFTLTVATASSNAVACNPLTITVNATTPCTSTTTFSDASTANTTVGAAIQRINTAVGGNSDATHTTIATSTPLNVLVGDTLYVVGSHGTDTTSTITVTDTAGNTPTSIGALTSDSGIGAAKQFVIPVTIANAADYVTITFNNPVQYDTVNVVQFRGLNTTPLDQHTEVVTTNPSNCTPTAITTTQAIEAIVGACRPGGFPTFSPASGYTLDTVDPTSQLATQSQLVSTIQTSISPGISYNTTSAHNIAFIASFKGASASGAAWSSTSNCTVDSSGVVTGRTVGSCTITAIFGGQTGTATVTVNPPSVTSITVSPATASGPINTTQQFTALDQSSNNITSSVTWASTLQSCVTISPSGLATVVSSSSCGSGVQDITATLGSASGSASFVGTGAASTILSGCTVSSTNVPSCATPSGWTLAFAQGFDTGTVPGGTQLFGSIQAGGHTGSNALIGTYNGGDQAVAIIFPGSTINSREMYASWWDMYEQPGRMNTEMFVARRTIGTVGSPTGTDIVIDWQNGANPDICYYNCTSGQMTFAGEGSGGVPNFNDYGSARCNPCDPKWGQWVQYELYLKANNPSFGNTGTNTDSIVQLWQNGVLIMQSLGRNINGSLDLTLAEFQIGGILTDYIVFTDQAMTICQTPNLQGGWTRNYTPWTTPNACPLQSPSRTYNGVSNTAGFGPTFRRRIDDIIVLKK